MSAKVSAKGLLKAFFYILERDIKTKNRVEWKKIREGSIAMEGFPQGIVPAPASHFGVPKLRRILNNLKHVTFRGEHKLQHKLTLTYFHFFIDFYLFQF